MRARGASATPCRASSPPHRHHHSCRAPCLTVSGGAAAGQDGSTSIGRADIKNTRAGEESVSVSSLATHTQTAPAGGGQGATFGGQRGSNPGVGRRDAPGEQQTRKPVSVCVVESKQKDGRESVAQNSIRETEEQRRPRCRQPPHMAPWSPAQILAALVPRPDPRRPGRPDLCSRRLPPCCHRAVGGAVCVEAMAASPACPDASPSTSADMGIVRRGRTGSLDWSPGRRRNGAGAPMDGVASGAGASSRLVDRLCIEVERKLRLVSWVERRECERAAIGEGARRVPFFWRQLSPALSSPPGRRSRRTQGRPRRHLQRDLFRRHGRGGRPGAR